MTSTLVCSDCGAKNRVGDTPGGQVPVCGRCGSPLPWLVQTGDQSFRDDLAAPVPVLVDFWAPWCGPCRMVAPVLEELAVEQGGRLKVLKLNVDENPRTSGEYRVMSIPTLILFREGKPVETIVGALPKSSLMQKLGPHLQPAV